MANLLAGIDVSLRSHSVQFMNENGDALASFSVPNNVTGAETLFKRIQFAGGTLHVLPYCVNGVINFLQLDKLLYLFKVNGIIHLLDPPEDS